MKKAINILQILKKAIAMLAPIILMVGGFLYILSMYTNETNKEALKVITSFGFAIILFAGLNIAHLILKSISNKKDDIQFKGFRNFCLKHQNIIGIILSFCILVLAVYLVALFGGKINLYFNVYFRLTLVLIPIMIYSIFTILISKNKKSLIINLIFSLIFAGLLVYLFVCANIMYFGKIGAYNNFLAYNIILIFAGIFMLLPLGFIVTHGDFEKFNMQTNFWLGLFSLLLSIILYFSNSIASKVINHYMYTFDPLVFDYLDIALKIVYIIFGIVLALSFVNVTLNLKKSVKSKNIFSLTDVALVVPAVCLAIIGLYQFSRYIMYV